MSVATKVTCICPSFDNEFIILAGQTERVYVWFPNKNEGHNLLKFDLPKGFDNITNVIVLRDSKKVAILA